MEKKQIYHITNTDEKKQIYHITNTDGKKKDLSHN